MLLYALILGRNELYTCYASNEFMINLIEFLLLCV